MFSTLPKTNFSFFFTFILSSANAFNLDQSKNMSFGKESKVMHANEMLLFTQKLGDVFVMNQQLNNGMSFLRKCYLLVTHLHINFTFMITIFNNSLELSLRSRPIPNAMESPISHD